MLRAVLSLLIILHPLAWPSPAHAHGTERHFGTPIIGVRATNESPGAPEFTLLALRSNLNALERDLEQDRIADVRERAHRLPRMAADLVARCRQMGSQEREQVGRAAQTIAEGARRIAATASAERTREVLRELSVVRGRIGEIERLLLSSKR